MPFSEVEQPLVPKGSKGRLPAGVARFDLKLWIKNNREDLYVRDEESSHGYKWFCLACNRVVMFQTSSTWRYLLAHEERQRHKDGLQRLREGRDVALALQDGAADASSHEQIVMVQECRGVLLDTNSNFLVGKLLDSCKNWMHTGFIALKPLDGEKDIFAFATWQCSSAGVILRHSHCEANSQVAEGLPCCMRCYGLANQPKIAEEIAKWSYKIDLTQLAFDLCHGVVD